MRAWDCCGLSTDSYRAYRIQQLVLLLPSTGAVALRSGHSVDVVAPGVSKLAVVERVWQAVGVERDVLCIGDRGRWPGNDHVLLTISYSLSADEVSADPAACWNLFRDVPETF